MLVYKVYSPSHLFLRIDSDWQFRCIKVVDDFDGVISLLLLCLLLLLLRHILIPVDIIAVHRIHRAPSYSSPDDHVKVIFLRVHYIWRVLLLLLFHFIDEVVLSLLLGFSFAIVVVAVEYIECLLLLVDVVRVHEIHLVHASHATHYVVIGPAFSEFHLVVDTIVVVHLLVVLLLDELI